MSFLKKAIQKGISKGVSDALGKAIQQAVEPKANELVNKAAVKIDEAAQNASQQFQQSQQQFQQANQELQEAQQGLQEAGQAVNTSQTVNSLGSLFSQLESAAKNYANEAAKTTKICPGCGKTAGADIKFCPSCGSKLPEETVAQSAVCPSCGKQNEIGTKFCADCGTKLPAAVQEEQAAQAKDDAVMAQWDEYLAVYPKWNCGGSNYCLDDYGEYISFSADFKGNSMAARAAVEQYRQVLLQNGFRQAGQYPSPGQLFARINGVVYNVDTEHCFEGDSDCPTIGFAIREPTGGFDYVKPEPKKPTSLKDLFNF